MEDNKAGTIFIVCVAVVICTITICVSIYNYSIESKAIENGLVQEVVGNRIIWSKPKDK